MVYTQVVTEMNKGRSVSPLGYVIHSSFIDVDLMNL